MAYVVNTCVLHTLMHLWSYRLSILLVSQIAWFIIFNENSNVQLVMNNIIRDHPSPQSAIFPHSLISPAIINHSNPSWMSYSSTPWNESIHSIVVRDHVQSVYMSTQWRWCTCCVCHNHRQHHDNWCVMLLIGHIYCHETTPDTTKHLNIKLSVWKRLRSILR